MTDRERNQRREASRRWRARNPGKAAERERFRKLGVTPSDYAKMLDAQSGVCLICKKSETSTRKGRVKAMAVDHCHNTGRIRGLLCQKCNTGLGQFQDSVALLKSAIAHIESFQTVHR